MKVRLYGPTINQVLASKTELTIDKVYAVLAEDQLLLSEPKDNAWFENLEEGIIVFNPKVFGCALIPLTK